jgi:hypothetical protein
MMMMMMMIYINISIGTAGTFLCDMYGVIGTEERGITAVRCKLMYAKITACFYVSVEVLELGGCGLRRYPGGY